MSTALLKIIKDIV